MTPAEITDTDIADLAAELRAQGAPFAIATVVRTLGATSAKPGAKALLDETGEIRQGWIGGGCVRGMLRKATCAALQDGQPQLISVQPKDLLADQGIDAGRDLDGIRYAANGCPSQGSIDIFVEPILPLPELVIFGASPVATALAQLGAQFHWAIRAEETAASLPVTPDGQRRMIVVATQGAGDLEGLKQALATQAEHIAFVGSRRKFATLSDRLISSGISQKDIARIETPAGLPINAVSPDEIALSILARLTQLRRENQRDR